MDKKWWVVIVALLIVVVFTVQNYTAVSMKVLFWSINTSLAILVYITLVIGIIIGLLIRKKS